MSIKQEDILSYIYRLNERMEYVENELGLKKDDLHYGGRKLEKRLDELDVGIKDAMSYIIVLGKQMSYVENELGIENYPSHDGKRVVPKVVEMQGMMASALSSLCNEIKELRKQSDSELEGEIGNMLEDLAKRIREENQMNAVRDSIKKADEKMRKGENE